MYFAIYQITQIITGPEREENSVVHDIFCKQIKKKQKKKHSSKINLSMKQNKVQAPAKIGKEGFFS